MYMRICDEAMSRSSNICVDLSTASVISSLSFGDHAAGHPPIDCEIVLHQQLMMMTMMSAGGLDDLCECCSRCGRERSAAAKAL